MLTGASFKDKNIISRSFRFLSPNVSNPESILKQADYDLETSYFSTAIGDNRYLNPLPGFGFNTDPSPAIVSQDGIKNNLGNLGRYYKRIYDDNATLLTITAGVPEFTGILRFLVNMFDYSASLVTNKGRAPTYAFYISEAVSSVAFYPFQLIGVGMNFLAFLFDTPKNQWYYVKPTMGQYLAAAQGIFNDLMVSAGYSMTILNDSKRLQGNERRGDAGYNTGTITGYNAQDSSAAKQANIQYLNRLYPDAINDDGTIDIVKIVGRGARKYRYFLMQVKNLDKKVGSTITYEQKNEAIEKTLNNLMKDPDFLAGTKDGIDQKGTSYFLKKELSTIGKYRGEEEISNPEVASSYYDPATASQIVPTGADGTTEVYGQSTGGLSVQKISEKYGYLTGGNANTTAAAPSGAGSTAGNFTSASSTLAGTVPTSDIDVNKDFSEDGWFSQIFELVKDSFLGGMDAVTFRVEGGTGPVSDSFSNQTQQSEIAGFFNGTVSAVNNFKFNVQGGDTGIGFVDSILNRIKDGAAGLASGSVIGNIPLALMGNSRVVIPEHWADSQTNLHSESYEIYCDAMYGHPYSISTQIFLPLALIAPFVFPVSTGGSTYTTPFMCKVFSQGRTIIKTGMVRNASITFGEGELGWTRDRKPLNMRIRLEFVDLDPIVSVPVVRLKNALEVFNVTRTSEMYLGDVGRYNDWLARVTGQDYLDTILKYNKINRAVTRFTNDFQEIFSPGRIAGAISDSVVGDVGRVFAGRPLNR